MLNYGNKKLPKTTGIFNIPSRITCPGRTAFCENKCYALKAERLYPQVLPFRKRNFEASRRPDFPDLMIKAIGSRPGKINMIRIHESGDFYSQAYLDKWIRIAGAFPDLIFYAYTKSFYLNFTGKPSNLILIASFDHTTRAIDRLNYESKKKFFRNSFTIIDKNKKATCPADCRICQKCVTGRNLKITVNQH